MKITLHVPLNLVRNMDNLVSFTNCPIAAGRTPRSIERCVHEGKEYVRNEEMSRIIPHLRDG
jgi:hypothetical protein